MVSLARRPRFLLVGNYTFSLVNFRGDLIAELQRLGFEVIGCGPQEDGPTEDTLRDMGVQFVRIPLRRVGLNPVADLQTLVFFWRLCRRVRPDVVLSYTVKPVIYMSLAAKWAGCDRIYSLLTGLGTPFLSRGPGRGTIRRTVEALYRRALRFNRRVFFQNPDDIKHFVDAKLLSPDQVVMTNGSGVNIERFPAVPVPEGPPRFLLIARMVTDKGILEYAEAARIVKLRCPEAVFELIGPPEDHPKAISLADLSRWHDEGLLIYHGRIADVRPYLARCTVYVLPSYREGTPRSVLEALATGRAVITTDAPGCRETVRDGENGYLVPVKDAGALAAAMLRLVADPRLVARMGEASRRLAVDVFDVQHVNRSLLEGMGLLEP